MSTHPKTGPARGPASGLSSEEQRRRAAVRRLPAPQPGVVISVPLVLWPLYMELHHLEPKRYDRPILIVKRLESE